MEANFVSLTKLNTISEACEIADLLDANNISYIIANTRHDLIFCCDISVASRHLLKALSIYDAYVAMTKQPVAVNS